MRANRLKELWAAGKPVINGWCNLPGAFSAELMAGMGWDAVTIDTQHGLIGYSEMVAMLQAVSTTSAVPLVRVPWNSPGELMKALDAGAYGVICPMINDAAEAAAFVQACRYPPAGFRSFGPIRAGVYAGADYFAHANDEILTFAMIETAAGLQNAEAICATPGLSGVYIGPSDLSLGIGGGPGQDQTAPELMAAFDRIIAACRGAGIRVGVHTSSLAYAKQMVEKGFDLVTAGGDMRYLMGGRREAADMKAWLDAR
jgi:4-hydroxy-2-oxoheptanedioate aldolase